MTDQSVVLQATDITVLPGSNDNMAWHNYRDVILPALSGDFTITGIQAPTYNDFSAFTNDTSEVGKHIRGPLHLVNASGHVCSLGCESASSTAANQLTIPGVAASSSYSLQDGYTAVLLYDYGVSLWRVIAVFATGGVALKTNGVTNSDQTALNLTAGANVTLTAGAGGLVTIDAISTGGGTDTQTVYLNKWIK